MIKVIKELSFNGLPGVEPVGVTKVYVFGVLVYAKIVKE